MECSSRMCTQIVQHRSAKQCQATKVWKNSPNNDNNHWATATMKTNRVYSMKEVDRGWMRQSVFFPPMIGGPMCGSLVSCNCYNRAVVACILQLDVVEHKPTMTITNDGMLDTSHQHNNSGRGHGSSSSNDNNSNNLNKEKKNDKILKMNESVWQNTAEIYWLLVLMWSPNVMNSRASVCV